MRAQPNQRIGQNNTAQKLLNGARPHKVGEGGKKKTSFK